MMARALPLLLIICLSLAAGELRFAGVVGNSGESGETLARASRTGDRRDSNLGIGIVRDQDGCLWTRVGTDTLNRYAPDGRCLESIETPRRRISHVDALRGVDGHLVLFSDSKLFVRPVDGGEWTALTTEVDGLGYGDSRHLAAHRAGRLLLLDPVADTAADLGALGFDRCGGLAIGPDGDIVAISGPDVYRFRPTGEPVAGWPRRISGKRESAPWGIVFAAGYWYGFGWHETIKRYTPDWEPAPGVVYGGNSGWFIGSVPEHGDLEAPQGLVALPDGQVAVCGNTGHILVLAWQEDVQRFDPVRRIGALPTAGGLALDNEGRIWFDGGQWEWTAGPDTPHRFSSQSSVPGALAVLPGGQVVGISTRHGRAQWLAGALGDKPRQDQFELPEGMPLDPVAVVPLADNRPPAALVLGGDGAAWAVRIGNDGRFNGILDERLDLPPAEVPYTDAVQPAPGELLAAAGGAIVHLRRGEEAWEIVDTWGGFTGPLRLSCSEDRLWVADAAGHQVQCFAWPGREPLAAWGVADTPGSAVDRLDTPGAIAARGRRATVYDAGNQRLVKLDFVP